MAEIDGYERNVQYYHERTQELRGAIRHMDVHCPSFCVESDGIRVALVAELLRNALSCQIQEACDLLDEYVKPFHIAKIVHEAIEYARAGRRARRDTRGPLENIDIEAEAAKLEQEMEGMQAKGLHEDLKGMVLKVGLRNFEQETE